LIACIIYPTQVEPEPNVLIYLFHSLRRTGVNIIDNRIENDFFIYPNPSPGEFTIEFREIYPNSSIMIYNTLGEVYYHINLNSSIQNNKNQIEISGLPEGVYYVKCLSGKMIKVKILIISR
jgi:hypothetical protein